MKSMLSARHSMLRSVSSTFFIEAVDWFPSDFFNEVTLFLHIRSESLIFAKIYFVLVFGPKRPQSRAFCKDFRKFCHFISPKHSENY